MLVGSGDFASQELREALRERFEVEVVSPEDALVTLRTGEHDAVLAQSSAFHALERGEAAAQTNAIFNAIGEAVCLCEGEGKVSWFNSAFDALDEHTRQRAIDLCTRRLAGEDHGPPRRQRFADAAGARWYEAIITDIENAPAWVGAGRDASRAKPPRFVIAALRDVTDVQRTQLKIDTLDRAGQELVRLETDTVRKMHVHDRLEFLRGKIVQLAHDLLQFDHFVVWLVDPETNRLEQVISAGLSEEVKSIRLLALRENNGISGYVAATGRSYICHDAAKDPRYIQGLDAPGSSLTVPLFINDKVVGVFNVESDAIGAFTEDDRHFAEIFGRHVALALHMLNLLVVERVATNVTASELMQDELSEPLNDLEIEAEWLREQGAVADPKVGEHIERMLKDIESIKRRIRDVARGPRSILGVERELEHERTDPLLHGRCVLVADDEPDIRNLIRDVLRNRGANPIICATGAEAIDELERITSQSPGSSGSVDIALVISDIKMPDRNGYEVFSEARKRLPDVPVILMTGFGYDPHHSIVRASQEGLQCVLFKPFQVERLLSEIHKALGEDEQPSD
ncbi:MAG: response regulator [Phycisphaerales bacterium]|nr:MAG: response regulator [Phycisphaerales bacterium]